MGTYEDAMDTLRGKLTEARRRYEQAIVEVNALREAYAQAHEAWWQTICRPNGSGSGIIPEHIKQQRQEMEAAVQALFKQREESSMWRKRLFLVERAHIRDELHACPACGAMAAILSFEEDDDVSQCCICQHTQVRHVFEFHFTPSSPSPRGTAVQWERGHRAERYIWKG